MEARAGGSSVVRLVRWCRGGSEVGGLQEGGGGCGSVEVAPASRGGSCNVGGVRAGGGGRWAGAVAAAGWGSLGRGGGGCGVVKVSSASISGGRGAGGVGRIAARWGRVWRC